MATSNSTISTGRKLALIIGNNDYSRPESKLRHCINDATDLSAKLEIIGFQVHKHINLNNEQMTKAIHSFSKIIQDGDLVLFYFSGHGYQVRAFNYLMPIDDEEIMTEDDVEESAVSVELTMERLAKRNRSHVTIFILDCCRTYWPRQVSKTKGGAGKGLSFMDAPAGTFLQFACGANRTACDGAESERNGLFTKHLLQHIGSPNEDIVQIFQGVAGDVYTESQGRQKPLGVNGLVKKGHVYLYKDADVKRSIEPKEASDDNTEKKQLVINTATIQPTETVSMRTGVKSPVHSLRELRSSHSLGLSFELNASDDRYMILTGRLTGRQHLHELTDTVDALESDTTLGLTLSTTEKLEHLLKYVTLESSIATGQRNDHFTATLLNLLGQDTSFESLKHVCRHHEASGRVNIDEIMKTHEDRVHTLASYFSDKGLAVDTARAAVFALSFYTKTKSNVVDRTARRIARQSTDEPSDDVVIVFYLLKALSFIPYYWGQVTCAYQLTDEELELYHPGAVITWIQFVRGRKVADRPRSARAPSRNTQFLIHSLTGRLIQQFSHYPDEEEILFLPRSTYFVYQHERSRDGKQHTISMRQVELGLSKYSILWVDGTIFQNQGEVKSYMETATRDEFNLDVHFIPRSSTNSALTFLQSPFGQRLKNQSTFRIITCMSRKGEEPAHTAGIRLIKSMRELGFENQCLVFTGDRKRAETIVQSELSATEQKCVTVADRVNALKDFISFRSSE